MASTSGGGHYSTLTSAGSPVYTGLTIDAANTLYIANNYTYKTNIPSEPFDKFVRAGGYFLSSPLPSGLFMADATGIITGTPLVVGPARSYTITAYNHDGSSTANVKIQVNPVPPVISYNTPVTYSQFAAIPVLVPASAGVAAPAYSAGYVKVNTSFNHPEGVAIDAAGNLYIANTGANTVKKVAAGSGAVLTLGSGFNHPEGVAVDAAGNVYVADFGNNSVKKIPIVGGPPVALGSGFKQPAGVAVDAGGNVYVADYGDSLVEEILAGSNTPVVLSGGTTGPSGIAVDAYGDIFVSYHFSNKVVEMKAGTNTPVTIATGFTSPGGLTVDPSGNVFIADGGNNNVTEIPADGSSPIVITGSQFTPAGVAVDVQNNLFVADPLNSSVKKIQPIGGYYINAPLPAGLSFNTTTGQISGIPAVPGPAANYVVTAYNIGGGGSATINITVNAVVPIISYTSPQVYKIGAALTPLAPVNTGAAVNLLGHSTKNQTLGFGLVNPYGIAVDGAGNVYVADRNSNKVAKLSAADGTVTAVGSGFVTPQGVAVDAAGNVYVSDVGDGTVKKIPAGGGPTAIVASGFGIPSGLAIDGTGNIYVTDSAPGAGSAIKIIANGGGMVTLRTGFSNPQGIAVDASGNVYVADANVGLKEIPANGGSPVTVAGSLTNTWGVAVDASGNIFVTNAGNVYRVAVGGGKVTVGTGLNSSYGVAVDGAGKVYATDNGNNIVYMIPPVGGYFVTPSLPAGLSFSSSTGVFSGTPATASPATYYTVTAYNKQGSNTTKINLKVLSNSADLSGITLSSGTLSPAFIPATVGYAATVTNNTAAITLTATTTDPGATLTVNGIAVMSGKASASIPLTVGPNTITIIVTAADGITNKTYTITVTRALSVDATLSGLGVSVGTLTPVFAAGTTSYSASVGNGITSTTITPSVTDANATVTVNGITVKSGTASTPIPLNIGINNITITVTAADGLTTMSYSIAFTRAASPNANLANLKINNGTIVLTPAFNFNTISYTASVPAAMATINVIPATADANATVTINDAMATSGTASTLPLNAGQNVITTVVTAADGITTKTYSITVTRAPSADAKLADLTTSSGTLTPVFAPATISYTENVNNTTASVTVTPTTDDPTATVTVNGMAVTSGAASAGQPLVVGQNAITITVTAADEITTKTYTVTVVRAPSTDANLADLTTSSGTLAPVFAAATVSYTENVAYATASITVTPTTDDPTATVTVNGTVVTSGAASAAQPLAVGQNAITIVVTAQDGTTTMSYTISVTRAPSNNANLSNLKINSGSIALTPAFSFNTTSYTAGVTNATTSVKVTPATADATATVSVNGVTVVSGAQSASLPLVVGTNTITTVVTAQDGSTTKTYAITVTRATGPVAKPLGTVSADKPVTEPQPDDGIVVHRGISANGDGINDYLAIDGITNYPDNKLTIVNHSGQIIYEVKGYNNSTRVFDGHSSKTGARQLPGTYFYSLDYTVRGVVKHKTGFIILKY